MILEFGGHVEGVEHFGISEAKRVEVFMPAMVGYRHFLESPSISTNTNI